MNSANVCPKCGTAYREGNVFCIKCGAKREEIKKNICGKCGSENTESAESCINCGETLALVKTKPNKLASISSEILKQQLTSERANYSNSALALMEEELERRNEKVIVRNTKTYNEGSKLNICSKCGTTYAEGKMYCSQCGTPRDTVKNRICKKCGSELHNNDEFCPKCGQKVNIISNQLNAEKIKNSTKTKKIPIFIGAVAAVVVVSIFCIISFSGLFGKNIESNGDTTTSSESKENETYNYNANSTTASSNSLGYNAYAESGAVITKIDHNTGEYWYVKKCESCGYVSPGTTSGFCGGPGGYITSSFTCPKCGAYQKIVIGF